MNVVLWPMVFERYALLANTTTSLGATGTLQAQQGAVHLVGEVLWTSQV